MFGDFEDLETGEVHKADESGHSEGEGEGNDENEEKKIEGDETRLEKKKKQKAAFNSVYPWWRIPDTQPSTQAFPCHSLDLARNFMTSLTYVYLALGWERKRAPGD